jgi:hypothetical protein
LVVGAAALVDETVAEDDGGVVDGFGDDVAAEVFVAAVGEEGTAGVWGIVGRRR